MTGRKDLPRKELLETRRAPRGIRSRTDLEDADFFCYGIKLGRLVTPSNDGEAKSVVYTDKTYAIRGGDLSYPLGVVLRSEGKAFFISRSEGNMRPGQFLRNENLLGAFGLVYREW